MAGKSKARILIRMVAQDGSGHFYTTSKNPRTSEGKLVLNKYNPRTRQITEYKEAKIK